MRNKNGSTPGRAPRSESRRVPLGSDQRTRHNRPQGPEIPFSSFPFFSIRVILDWHHIPGQLTLLKSAFSVLLALLMVPSEPVQARPEAVDQLAEIHRLLAAGRIRDARTALEHARAGLHNAVVPTPQRLAILDARLRANADQSGRALRMVENLLETTPDLAPRERLEAHTLAADLHLNQRDFEQAFEHFRAAMQEIDRVGDVPARIRAWMLAADIHIGIGEPGTALEFAAMALEQLAQQPEPAAALRCKALSIRGHALLMNQQSTRALEVLTRALEACPESGNSTMIGEAWLAYGDAAGQAGREEEVLQAMESAIRAFDQAGDENRLAIAQEGLARYWINRQRPEQARKLVESLVARVESIKDDRLRSSIHALAARIATLDGDPGLAYQLRRQELELLHSAGRQRQRMRLMLLLSNQRNRRQRITLELLNGRNEMLELDQVTRQQNLLSIGYLGSGSILASVLLAVLLIKSGRDRSRLQQMSRYDGLTGLYTHSRFFELGEQMVKRARQSGMPLTLLLADADHFKQVNDKFGHLAGDRLLEHLGRAFRRGFDPNAIIGRLGGEEFGVLIEDCDLDRALAQIERLRAEVGATGPGEPMVTLSFGVAELVNQRNLEMLFTHADQALYDAKDTGRNRVVTVARIQLGNATIIT